VLTIYSDSHRLHHGHGELIFGELRPCFEKPVRADMILERVRAAALGEVRAPTDFGSTPLVRVHAPDYVQFLETAWDQWSQLGYQHDALPMSWPVHGLRNDRPPTHIEGKVGYYAFDAGAPITAGTWEATRQSAVHLVGTFGVPGKHTGRARNIDAQCVVHRLAHIGAVEPGQFIRMLQDQVRQACEHLFALAGTARCPDP